MNGDLIDLDEGGELLASLKADVYGRSCDIVYRAHLYTPAMLRQEKGVSEILLTLVESWGLTRAGEPVPITEEALSTVPLAVQRAIWQAIAGDFDPNPKWSDSSAKPS